MNQIITAKNAGGTTKTSKHFLLDCNKDVGVAPVDQGTYSATDVAVTTGLYVLAAL